MIKNSRPEEGSMIKGVRNIFRLKNKLNYIAVKDCNYEVTTILNTKVTVIKIEKNQLKNILIKLVPI